VKQVLKKWKEIQETIALLNTFTKQSKEINKRLDALDDKISNTNLKLLKR
jgi:tetrahydromethanopterin S-methyltransferase subunit G